MDALERFIDQEALIIIVLCLLAASVLSITLLVRHLVHDWLNEEKPIRWLPDISLAIVAGSSLALFATAARSLIQ